MIYGSYARRLAAPDHPIGPTQAEWDEIVQRLEREWGGPVAVDLWAPSMIHDERFHEGWAAYLRLAASPGAAAAGMRMRDLVAGSGLRFLDRGLQILKGVPGEWHLFALEPEGRRT